MIIQTDLDNNFIAVHETKTSAAKTLGLDESTIRKAVKFNRKVCGKFKFKESLDNDNIPNSVYTKKIETVKNSPKVLFVDIETAPIKTAIFKVWNTNVYPENILSDWFMLSWSAKWLGEDDVSGLVLLPSEVYREDDSKIVEELWKLFDEADIVVAHNGNKFDIPKINSRFLANNLMPPSPYKQIDTMLIARNMFGETYNKLDFLAKKFGYEGKYTTEMKLWIDCLNGKMGALLQMLSYNNQDVVILEKVYLKLRPYIKGHPNLNIYNDDSNITCPHCNSTKIYPIKGKYFYTNSSRYQLYTCKDCGAHSRGKKGIPYNNKKQIISIPR